MRLTLAVLLLLAGTARGESGAGGGGRVVRLRLAAGAAPDQALERFLREDLAWVARTPVETPGTGSVAAAARSPTRALSARLRDRWLARGYLAADCLPDSGADGATGAGEGASLVIAPGPRFRVGEVTVGGPDFAGRARALAAALPPRGSWFDPGAWEEAVARLLAAAGEAGHPFARWVIGEVRVDAARAAVDLTATLFTGPRAWLGPITSDLPGGRGAGFLRRASGLSPGAPYRESDLARARARLLERGVWLEVGEPMVHTANAADTVGVHWPVVPVPRPNRFTAMIGLSRRDEGSAGATASSGGSRLSGQVDLLLPDLAGTGRRLALAWTDDGRDRSRLGFSYLEPLAFGTPLDLEGSLAHEVEAESYTRFSADLRARLAVAGAWGLEFGLGRDRGTYPSGAWTSTRRLRARAALLRHRGDPGRSGWAGQFGLETARRQAVARVDSAAGAPVTPAGGTEARQSLLDLTWSGEAFLTATLSVAARGDLRRGAGRRRFDSAGGAVSVRRRAHAAWLPRGGVPRRTDRSRIAGDQDWKAISFQTLHVLRPGVLSLCDGRGDDRGSGPDRQPGGHAARFRTRYRDQGGWRGRFAWPSACRGAGISTRRCCTCRCCRPSEARGWSVVRRGKVVMEREDARAEIARLRTEIARHNHLYYAAAAPELEDEAYDALVRELQALEARFPGLAAPDSPTAVVGGDPRRALSQRAAQSAHDQPPEQLRRGRGVCFRHAGAAGAGGAGRRLHGGAEDRRRGRGVALRGGGSGPGTHARRRAAGRRHHGQSGRA